MTRTERAWQLFVDGKNRYGSFSHEALAQLAFTEANIFEAEAAKHEEPKAEGEVWYACAALDKYGELILHDGMKTKKEARENQNQINKLARDSEDTCFLVEVRRVN